MKYGQNVFNYINADKSSRLAGGGQSIKCDDPNQIVEVNLPQYKWSCSDNVDFCPGLGGFRVGCKDYVPTTTTTTTTTTPATSSTDVKSLSVVLLIATIVKYFYRAF